MKKQQGEPERETVILREYKDPAIKILCRIRDERRLAEVSRQLGIQNSRLSEIISGKRDLTLYYLGLLISGGIVTIDQILQGRKIEELPVEHQAIFRRLSLDDEIISITHEVSEKIGPELFKKAIMGASPELSERLLKAIEKHGRQRVIDILKALG